MLTGSCLTVRRELSRLVKTTGEVTAIAPSAIHRRLSEDGIAKEILPLIRAVNSALDRLETGYKLQGEFTANAAHELRTPIANIKADIAGMPLDAAQPGLLSDVAQLERIVSQLLRLAQADDFQPGNDEVADLRLAAQEVAGAMAPAAMRDGKFIAVMGVDGAVMVRGNAEYLQLAVRNLAENALAQKPIGESVIIQVENNASLRVRDRGPGVRPQDRAKVFERFWRGDHSGNIAGAGLGLSIVARIVGMHGGRIEISGAPGGGADFAIFLRAVN